MVHLHLNNHGILIITSLQAFTYLLVLRNNASNHFKIILNNRAVGTLGIKQLNLQITFFMQRTIIQSLLICFRLLTLLAVSLNVGSAISLMMP